MLAVGRRRSRGSFGTPTERIHIERFAADEEPDVPEGDESASVAAIEFDGQHYRLSWPAHKRLLDVMIDAGLNAPHSCRQGNCGACMLRILQGEVSLVHNEILEDEDFADNWTLACQAIPVTDHAQFTYEAE